MDANHYDRIADLLIQIRKKYSNLNPNDPDMKILVKQSILEIDFLLQNNDLLAKWDAKGWL
jgi:hypothetical protein